MRIVSSQSSEDRDKAASQEAVERFAMLLAANMLRVIRGAGKPHDLLPTMQKCIDAAHAFYDAHRQWPINEVQYAVQPEKERNFLRNLSSHELSKALAINDIIDGALQVTASRLLEQRTQEAAGRAQMMRGMERFESASLAIRNEASLAPRRQRVPSRKLTKKTR